MSLTEAIFKTLLLLAGSVTMGYIGAMITRWRWWLAAFVAAFLPIGAMVLFNRVPALHYSVPLMWLGKGYTEMVLMSLCVPLVFGILIPRLTIKRQKISISILAAVLVLYHASAVYLEPALSARQWARLETTMDDDVCLQTTNYTCGAASAVTALRQFGIEADESKMAIRSKTTRRWGTTEHLLSKAIKTCYGDQGIRCQCRCFSTIEELKGCCPVIVTVAYSFMVDHFVTVLEVTDETVVIGDPIKGRVTLPYEVFQERWRTLGICVSQKQ